MKHKHDCPHCWDVYDHPAVKPGDVVVTRTGGFRWTITGEPDKNKKVSALSDPDYRGVRKAYRLKLCGMRVVK